MSNTPLGPVLAGKTSSGSGEVTPASLLAATAEMTPAQQAEMRANIGATDTTTGLADSIKQALLDCFEHVAWIDDQGQEYYDALEAALYPLDHITAVYTQSGTVYDTDSLDSLKADLVVTAIYGSGNTETVDADDYTLSGTLTVGTSTITVSYGGKTTTFTVTVTAYLPSEYQRVEWVQSSGTQVIITDYAPQYADLPDLTMTVDVLVPSGTVSTTEIIAGFSGWGGQWIGTMTNGKLGLGNNIGFANVDRTQKNTIVMTWDSDNGYAKCGSETIQRSTTNQYELKFAMFATNAKSFWAKARIYSAQVSDDGVLVVDMIPCYRIADGVIGMYDGIARAFYSNEGTGTFTKGSDV